MFSYEGEDRLYLFHAPRRAPEQKPEEKPGRVLEQKPEEEPERVSEQKPEEAEQVLCQTSRPVGPMALPKRRSRLENNSTSKTKENRPERLTNEIAYPVKGVGS